MSAGNGTDTYTGLAQTLTITVLADPLKNKDYAWRQTAVNSATRAITPDSFFLFMTAAPPRGS